MSARLIAAAALALLAACGGQTPPPQPGRPGAKPAGAAPAAPTPTSLDPANTKPAEPEWSYTSVGKRDPFRSFMADASANAAGLVTRCATPLGRFELEQLRLVAVITGLEDPVAMVEAPNGVGYSLRRGACVGKNGGVVVAVRSGEVIVSEWVTRADGTRDAAQTAIRLPKEAGMNLEEAQ
jgi:type IV pilus assembly protein PilP